MSIHASATCRANQKLPERGVFAFKTTFFGRRLLSNIYAALVWSSIYAVSDEIHQHFTGFRFGSWTDFVADFIGILLFLLLAYFVLRRGGWQKKL